MGAYELIADSNNFRAYILANPDEWEVFDGAYGQRMRERWRPLRVEVERESRRRTPPGDFPCLFLGTDVAFSQRAVDELGSLLEPAGELLPLECDAEPLWFYNCDRFADVLDEQASDIRRYQSSGRIMTIHRHAWRPEVERETFFRLPQLHRSHVYATDAVVERIRSAGLRGFSFRG